MVYKSLILLVVFTTLMCCTTENDSYYQKSVHVLKDSTLFFATKNLLKKPITVTAAASTRSIGSIHDFYSEGDYWWPDTLNPSGAYIRRDGMTNPDNFTAHRKALIRFSEIVGNLTSAYLITKDSMYSIAALKHCKAWFITDSTKMNPNLLYAQAIQGRYTGRGIGIIDAIHFMEVVQSLNVLERHKKINENELKQIKAWFEDFLKWLTTHPYGQKEMVHPNNHGTCWNMQAGLYAVFTKNDRIIDFCRENYKNIVLPNQMASNGSFPRELNRTKPYGYSLFNLDAMVMNCVILSDDSNNLWTYTTGDGKTILKAMEYMKPYIADKSTWPLDHDVMYWENWPVAHPSLLFSGIYFNRADYFELWENKKHFLEIEEVRRNVPIRNPLLWIDYINIENEPNANN
jgi:alginate lyase